MTAPWLLFLTVALGLISGGGLAILTAPTAWFVTGMDAPQIMQAQTCALAVLDGR